MVSFNLVNIGDLVRPYTTRANGQGTALSDKIAYVVVEKISSRENPKCENIVIPPWQEGKYGFIVEHPYGLRVVEPNSYSRDGLRWFINCNHVHLELDINDLDYHIREIKE